MDIAPTSHAPPGPAPRFAADQLDGLVDLLQLACQPMPPPPAEARALALLGQSRQVAAGCSPFDETVPGPALWLVSSGCVTVGGDQRPRRSFQRGQWLDVANAWLGLPLDEHCVAEVDSTLYVFLIDEIELLCRHRSSVARALLGVLARHVRESALVTQQLLTQDVLARCATWLLDALRSTADGATIVLAQRKSTVASQLGTSPETFSRTLRRLREMGAIDVKGARILVRDASELHRLATASH